MSVQIPKNMTFKQSMDLIDALWGVFEAAVDDHSSHDFESECPICIGVRDVQRVLSEGHQ